MFSSLSSLVVLASVAVTVNVAAFAPSCQSRQLHSLVFSSFDSESVNGLHQTNDESIFSSAATNPTLVTWIGRASGVCLAAATCLALELSLIQPAWSVDLNQGETLFDVNCAGCHRGGANFIKEKKTLQKAALEKYLSTDQSAIEDFVKNGMPHRALPFKAEFVDTDYTDVTSFVADMAMNEKW